MSVDGHGALGMDSSGEGPPSVPIGRRERCPFAFLLATVWAVALLGLALVVTGGLGLITGVLGHGAGPTDTPRYQELPLAAGAAALGRDLVIAPQDATPDQIERLVVAVAAASPAGLLRLNVFTDPVAAQRRRELIASGIFARDTDQPDPPAWREVYPAWVGIYTRDPANGVHQLSICLNDPDHAHCTVKRYPLATP